MTRLLAIAFAVLLSGCATSGPVGKTNRFYRQWPTAAEIEDYRAVAERGP